MMRGSSLLLVPILLAVATAAGAQSETLPDHAWSRGTTLNVFAGGATAASAQGALAGAAFGWDLLPRIGIEASGAWLDRGAHASAFAASIGAYVNLTRPRLAVPFLKGGVGLYRASFDASQGTLPGFYAHRIASGSGTQTFTDPTIVAGGGVNIFATPRWAIRPQVDAIVVRRHSQSHVVSTLTVHVAYHFERDEPLNLRPLAPGSK